MNDSNFWSQSWWQGIGVVVSGILAITAIVITIRYNRKKKLGYKLLYAGSLLTIDSAIKKDLVITYKGHKVEQIHVLKLRIINSGKIPIKREDFESQIIVKLNNCSNLLSAVVTEYHPKNLNIELESFPRMIWIKPLLINPGDYFDIQATFDGVDMNFDIESRIEGISSIEFIRDYQTLGPIVISHVFRQAFLESISRF